MFNPVNSAQTGPNGHGWKPKCMILFPSPNFSAHFLQEENFLELIRGHFRLSKLNFLSETVLGLSIAGQTAELYAFEVSHPQNS